MTFPQGAQRNSIMELVVNFSVIFFLQENAGFSKRGNIFLKHIGAVKNLLRRVLSLSVPNMGDVPL